MSNHYDPTKDISPSAAYPEVSFQHPHSDDKAFKKKVAKTTWLLSLITVVELGIGFFIYYLHKGEPPYFFILLLKGIVCILTLAKAYYIVAVFMHLGDEIKNFVMTIVVPLLLFIWFIIAFLHDGNAFKNARNEFDKHHEEMTTNPQKNPAPVIKHEEVKGEGAGHH